jgi:DNA primase
MDKILEWLKLDARKSGDGYMVRCPFHKGGQEKRPSMGLNNKSGLWLFHCFTCGSAGTLPHLISSMKGVNVYEAIQILDGKFGVDYGSNAKLAKVSSTIANIPEWKERFKLKDGVMELSEAVLEIYRIPDPMHYLERRRITPETQKEWETGYDKWMERVTFPVRDEHGILVGIVGRSVNDKQPKYMFYEHFPKSGFLYGLNKAKGEQFVVVEGHIDALWLYQCGIENVVAIQGSHISEKQAELLKKYAKEVLVWLDNDDAGHAGRNRLRDMLEGYVKLYDVSWDAFPKATDPKDFSVQDVGKVIKSKRFYALRDFLVKF